MCGSYHKRVGPIATCFGNSGIFVLLVRNPPTQATQQTLQGGRKKARGTRAVFGQAVSRANPSQLERLPDPPRRRQRREAEVLLDGEVERGLAAGARRVHVRPRPEEEVHRVDVPAAFEHVEERCPLARRGLGEVDVRALLEQLLRLGDAVAPSKRLHEGLLQDEMALQKRTSGVPSHC